VEDNWEAFQAPIEVEPKELDALLRDRQELAELKQKDWRVEAVAWLRRRADEQERTNREFPKHVEAYPSWADRPRQFRWLAVDLEQEASKAMGGAEVSGARKLPENAREWTDAESAAFRQGWSFGRKEGIRVTTTKPANSEVIRLKALREIVPGLTNALLAAEFWIGDAGHGDNCFVSDHYEGDSGNQCNCGRDTMQASIQAALEEYDVWTDALGLAEDGQ
jgi:hypothetical protein